MAGLSIVLDSAQSAPDGSIALRFSKLFTENAGAPVTVGFHRAVLAPGAAAAELAAIEAQFAASGYGAISGRDRTLVEDLVAGLHTPERCAAYAEALNAAGSAGPGAL